MVMVASAALEAHIDESIQVSEAKRYRRATRTQNVYLVHFSGCCCAAESCHEGLSA